MADEPIYISQSSAKSIWQEYRIYEDRLEFGTLLGTMSVPFDQIETIEVAPSDLSTLLHGKLTLKNFRPALKLDWANLVEHVVIDKSSGMLHRVLFTPENPKEFLETLERALGRYRSGASST